MATDGSSLGQAWLTIMGREAEVTETESGQVAEYLTDLQRPPSPVRVPHNVAAVVGMPWLKEEADPSGDGRNASDDMETSAVGQVLFIKSGDRQKGLLQSELDHSVLADQFGHISEGPGSSNLLLQSPPLSPSAWGPSASQHFSYGESSMLNQAAFGHFDGPYALSEVEPAAHSFEALAAEVMPSRLKGKLENDEDMGDQPPEHALGFPNLWLGGLIMEPLFGAGLSLPPPATNSGLPVRGVGNEFLPEHQGLLPTKETGDADTGSDIEIERTALQELQHGPPLQPRSAMQHLRFPDKFRLPDKIHRKRAKFLPFLSRRHSFAVITRGTTTTVPVSNPSTHARFPPEGCDKPPIPPPPPPHGDSRDPMDSDDVEDDDDEDGAGNNGVVGMDDNEVRMDLTDDLLHKVLVVPEENYSIDGQELVSRSCGFATQEVFQVFSFLDADSLCKAAMVCRQWRVASGHEDFWKLLNFEMRQVTHDQVARLCSRYPKATQLNLKGAPCVDEILVREAMRSLRNLEVLTLGRGFLSDGFFYALVECASLQKLSITDAILGNGGAQEIQLRHESLRRLQIVKCRVLRIAIRCPQLESLSLKRTGTASALLHCPRLVNLDVSSCHKLSDAGVRAAATACPLLATLNMSNCVYVSDETLREISLVCTHLRILDASYCPNISLEGVRMPMLIELKVESCEGINSSSMAALSHCVMLEVLAMDLCWLLTAVTLDLPRLRAISLSHNRKFVELTLRSPALLQLNLTHCPALNRVDISSSSLQKLELRQQMGLASMALQCPWLREVDLTECESLTDSVCKVFSDGGGCPMLNSLILDNCDGLGEVKLSTSSLNKLSLVGCRNISSLELACPVLHHLQLDGCDRLIAASFAPVGLLSLNLGICPHLTKLEIEAAQMTMLDLRGCGALSQASIRCPRLLSLDASYCSQLSDDCLAATTAACPAIQSLVLAACPAVGPAGLLALKKLRDLTTLDLSYTFLTDLSPIFEACPRLKVLRLSACKYLGETALDALHGGKVLSELRELDMSYGSLGPMAIEGVLALCPHLTYVSLNGCGNVTDHLWSRLACPPLPVDSSTSEDTGMEDAGTYDAVTDQQSPMDVAFPRVSTPADGVQLMEDNVAVGERKDGAWGLRGTGDCSHDSGCEFEPVTSSGMSGLHIESSPGEVQWSCEHGEGQQQLFTPMLDAEVAESVRALQTLNCVGCPNIRTVVIPQHAACLHLASLNLSLSNNIREVRLGCINLTSLNLSNCAALVVLELECPRLITLSLQACGIEADVLEQAVHGCSLLETLDVRNCSKVSSRALGRMRSVCNGLKRLYSTSSF